MEKEQDYNLRAQRKDEHIKYFLESSQSRGSGFEDIILQNNSLPEISFHDINTKTNFLKKEIGFPLLINAITGGTEYTKGINEKLALIAAEYNIPIAVGSQTIAVNNPDCEESFRIVRSLNREGIVIANLSANRSYGNVIKAIEILEADAVQLHLNAAQEMAMAEGDRIFSGVLENIRMIVKNINIPVIVKEVGFGMSFETAKRLYEAGVCYIDIGGKGGTNFVEIEGRRAQNANPQIITDGTFLQDWGIPTALSLLECVNVAKDLNVICTGGIKTSNDIVKALVVGADMVGMSGAILRELMSGSTEAVRSFMDRIIYETKVLMLLLGAREVSELKDSAYILKGDIGDMYRFKFV